MVIVADLAIHRAMRGNDRGSEPAPGGQRTDRRVIVYDVDSLVPQEPGRPGYVEQLRHPLADALGRRLFERGPVATG